MRRKFQVVAYEVQDTESRIFGYKGSEGELVNVNSAYIVQGHAAVVRRRRPVMRARQSEFQRTILQRAQTRRKRLRLVLGLDTARKTEQCIDPAKENARRGVYTAKVGSACRSDALVWMEERNEI
jgi:hypothetical protein